MSSKPTKTKGKPSSYKEILQESQKNLSQDLRQETLSPEARQNLPSIFSTSSVDMIVILDSQSKMESNFISSQNLLRDSMIEGIKEGFSNLITSIREELPL